MQFASLPPGLLRGDGSSLEKRSSQAQRLQFTKPIHMHCKPRVSEHSGKGTWRSELSSAFHGQEPRNPERSLYFSKSLNSEANAIPNPTEESTPISQLQTNQQTRKEKSEKDLPGCSWGNIVGKKLNEFPSNDLSNRSLGEMWIAGGGRVGGKECARL